jgi:hypothetical protein
VSRVWLRVLRVAAVVGVAATAAGAAAEPPPLPATSGAWRDVFAGLPVRGDGMESAAVGGGRFVYVTGDAVPGAGGPGPHSTLTVVERRTAHVVRPAHPGAANPYQFVPDPADRFHWLGPSFYAGGRLYTFAPLIAVGGGAIGTDLVVSRVPPDGDPAYAGTYPTPSGAGIVWGSAGVWYDAGTSTVYVAGTSRDATDGWTGRDLYLARVPAARLTDPGSWAYWTGSGWTAGDQPNARPLLTSARDGGVEDTVSLWRDRSGWYVTSRLGGVAGRPVAARWHTAALGQPWSRADLAAVPAGAYLVQEHWDAGELAAGTHLLTYCLTGEQTVFTEVPAPDRNPAQA